MCRRINCVRNDRSSWTFIVVRLFHERDTMPQAPLQPQPPLGCFFLVAPPRYPQRNWSEARSPRPEAEVIDLSGIAHHAIGHDGDDPAAMVA